MISPYDLGEFNLVGSIQSVRIDELVRKVNSELKEQLLKSKLDVLGVQISLTTSKTRFGGLRLWFLCPICNRRRGVLYSRYSEIACGVCLNLKYRKQRYKGMLELQSNPTP